MKLIIMTPFVFFAFLHAEIVKVDTSATYNCNYQYEKCDDKKTIKKLAIELAKINAIEEIGTVVKSTMEISNSSDGNHFSKHDIKTYAVGLLKTKVIDVKFSDNGESCYVEISSSVNTDEMKTLVKKVVENDEIAKEIKNQQDLQYKMIIELSKKLDYIENNRANMDSLPYNQVINIKSIQATIKEHKINYFSLSKKLKENIHELLTIKKGTIYESFLKNKIAFENARSDLELNFIDEYLKTFFIQTSKPKIITLNDTTIQFIFHLKFGTFPKQYKDIYYPCDTDDCINEAKEFLDRMDSIKDSSSRNKIISFKKRMCIDLAIKGKAKGRMWNGYRSNEDAKLYKRFSVLSNDTFRKYNTPLIETTAQEYAIFTDAQYNENDGEHNTKLCTGNEYSYSNEQVDYKHRRYYSSHYYDNGPYSNINNLVKKWLNNLELYIRFETNLGKVSPNNIKITYYDDKQKKVWNEIKLKKNYSNESISLLSSGGAIVKINLSAKDAKEITAIYAIPNKKVINP